MYNLHLLGLSASFSQSPSKITNYNKYNVEFGSSGGGGRVLLYMRT